MYSEKMAGYEVVREGPYRVVTATLSCGGKWSRWGTPRLGGDNFVVATKDVLQNSCCGATKGKC